MKINEILSGLDKMIENPRCELDYKKDYELLIATVLSAQCTDARVNKVTKVLWSKYDLKSLSNAKKSDIEKIIYSCGNYKKKSEYIINIAKSLLKDYDGKVPNDREYLESLSGVGRKTVNVVLSNIYNEPLIAVDTHVDRVSKRLGLANDEDNVLQVENKLMKKISKNLWSRTHHQLVLFGRYICKSKKPNCNECLLTSYCKYYKKYKKN